MTEFKSPELLPVGAAITLLADTFGDQALTGTIAGHVVYTRPDTGAPQPGYAIHLDEGFFAPSETLPIGMRPWIGTIVAHVESVEARA